jgi:hypothetical protein
MTYSICLESKHTHPLTQLTVVCGATNTQILRITKMMPYCTTSKAERKSATHMDYL